MWVTAIRSGVYTAGQTGTQAVEAYHFVLKQFGLRPRQIVSKRVDWLLGELLGRVLDRYRLKATAQQAGG